MVETLSFFGVDGFDSITCDAEGHAIPLEDAQPPPDSAFAVVDAVTALAVHSTSDDDSRTEEQTSQLDYAAMLLVEALEALGLAPYIQVRF